MEDGHHFTNKEKCFLILSCCYERWCDIVSYCSPECVKISVWEWCWVIFTLKLVINKITIPNNIFYYYSESFDTGRAVKKLEGRFLPVGFWFVMSINKRQDGVVWLKLCDISIIKENTTLLADTSIILKVVGWGHFWRFFEFFENWMCRF